MILQSKKVFVQNDLWLYHLLLLKWGVCASPASVAVVSVVAMLVAANFPASVVTILAITIPATFCGVIVAGIWSMRRGKDLANDPDFQERIKNPEQRAYIYEEKQRSKC